MKSLVFYVVGSSLQVSLELRITALISHELVTLRIDDKWLHINEETIRNHPGGAVIRQYANSDATQIFQAFHEGSKKAFKQLEVIFYYLSNYFSRSSADFAS
ncbi:hypothetical protein COOONC_19992 [Cooperia oncophora]